MLVSQLTWSHKSTGSGNNQNSLNLIFSGVAADLTFKF